MTLIFDIETIPLDFETSFDEVQQEYLLRGATTPGLTPISVQSDSYASILVLTFSSRC